MKLADIEKAIFHSKNEVAYAPEAIDGGCSERPVSYYDVFERNGKFKAVFVDVFDCYDGWDSMDFPVDDEEYDTYAEACFACYLDMIDSNN